MALNDTLPLTGEECGSGVSHVRWIRGGFALHHAILRSTGRDFTRVQQKSSPGKGTLSPPPQEKETCELLHGNFIADVERFRYGTTISS